MRFTRNKGSKYLRARTAGGRFTRPTVEDVFGMTACKSCGRFYASTMVNEKDPFPMPVRVKVCPHCGAARD
jgi:uncharacterized OB-fold protein